MEAQFSAVLLPEHGLEPARASPHADSEHNWRYASVPNRATARNIKAKELSPGLRRRLHLTPDQEITVTVTMAGAKAGRERKDPWAEIRGILSPHEADEMLRAIHESRQNKSEAPGLDSP